MLRPLIPFTAEEVYSYMPGKRLDSVHLLLCIRREPSWPTPSWKPMGAAAQGPRRSAQAARGDAQVGEIGAPLDAAISLGADGGTESGLAETLKRYRDELKICSSCRMSRSLTMWRRPRLGQANGREDFTLDGNGTFARAAAIPRSR